MPWHFGHSCNFAFPMRTSSMPSRQRGQSSLTCEATSVRSMAAPQCEQNFAPANTMPKHDGQAARARREPQYSHWVASEGTGAPQVGQFIVAGAVIYTGKL